MSYQEDQTHHWREDEVELADELLLLVMFSKLGSNSGYLFLRNRIDENLLTGPSLGIFLIK